MARSNTARVQRMCKLFAHEDLSWKDAAALTGMKYTTFMTGISGEDPDRPEWRKWKDRAAAKANQRWLGKFREFADKGNRAGVESAMAVLRGNGDERFRKAEKGARVPQIAITFLEAPADKKVEVRLSSEEFIEAETKALPGGEGG